MNLGTLKLESLSVEELSALHDRVRHVLTKKIEDEKRKLEATLANLAKQPGVVHASARRVVKLADARGKQRRKYPPVQPKYRNPADRSQTWAGRGKQPRWLVAQLKSGKKVEDFLIKRAQGGRG